jgi:hypothetical protein
VDQERVKRMEEALAELPNPVPYIPAWLRKDRYDRWEPEENTHILMRVGNRFYDSDTIRNR